MRPEIPYLVHFALEMRLSFGMQREELTYGRGAREARRGEARAGRDDDANCVAFEFLNDTFVGRIFSSLSLSPVTNDESVVNVTE